MAKIKSKTSDQPKTATPAVPRAKCGQCGRELRHLPFALPNVMCRECYGLERDKRQPLGIIVERPQEGALPDEAIVA